MSLLLPVAAGFLLILGFVVLIGALVLAMARRPRHRRPQATSAPGAEPWPRQPFVEPVHISPDGLWRWDGRQWVPNAPPPPSEVWQQWPRDRQ